MNQDEENLDQDSQSKNYSRKELVYMTKIYTKAHRYEDAINYSMEFIQMNPILTQDERTLFINAFKNSITKTRSQWRKVHNLEKKELKDSIENNNTKNPKLEYLKEVRHKIEKDLRLIIMQMITIISEILIPSCEESVDDVVFYLKIKGDYLRYLAEITGGEDRLTAIAGADENYESGYQFADEALPVTSATRLGLCLNYSVFLWEIKEMKQEAAIIAQNAYNLVIDKIEELENTKSKEAIIIIQLLRENLLMWSKEIVDDGEDPQDQNEQDNNENENDDQQDEQNNEYDDGEMAY